MAVVVVKELSGLVNYLPDWEELAERAIEPNVFYEPWFLVPAIKAFADGRELQFVLVFASDPNRPAGPRLLCGLFPLERKSRCLGLPIPTLALWKHIHCFLCTPLLRASHASETLATFFHYLESDDAGCSLAQFKFIPGEGPLNQLLTDRFYERASPVFVSECYTRAVILPASDASSYLSSAIAGRHRKELRRKENGLAELGKLEYRALDSHADPEVWIQSFLELEASGWKGKEGSALAAKESERSFFQIVAREAFRRGRLMMLAIYLDGQAIAQKCNFLAKDGAFAFKIAYNEEYAQFSPGMLLEIENIRRVHATESIHWMDSCAAPGHFMINRLWTERRTVQTIVVPARKGFAEFLVSLMPLLRWIKRKLHLRLRDEEDGL